MQTSAKADPGPSDFLVQTYISGKIFMKIGSVVFSKRELTFTLTLNDVNDSRSLSSSVRLSVCRLSVTFVHPTQAIEIFGNVSTPFGTLAICWDPGKILRRSSQGNPSVGELNTRGVAEYSDFGPIERYISETVQDSS